MKRLFALAALALPLAGCQTPQLEAVFKDLQTCDRDYNVALGSGGAGLSGPSFTATGHIQCKAQPAQPAGTPPSP